MAVICTECERKFIDKASLEKHMDSTHPDWRTPKQKGWATPYGFIDFCTPVTYAHACMIGLQTLKIIEEKQKAVGIVKGNPMTNPIACPQEVSPEVEEVE